MKYFVELLTLLLIYLKLTNQFDYSWLVVTAPMWLSFVVIFSLRFLNARSLNALFKEIDEKRK